MPPTRMVADASLALLARRLRLLGYDVRGLGGARLEELFAAARRDGRAVLTPSARHPRRFADVAVVRVPLSDPVLGVRIVAQNHEPASPPFSRCPECNGALARRHPMEASGEVPGRVLRTARVLQSCPDCGKWYWDGSHVARLRAWLETALGRPLPEPA